MKNTEACALVLGLVIAVASDAATAGGFFTVHSVRFVARASDREKHESFQPFIEVSVSTEEQIRAATLYARAYFYDGAGKLVEKATAPRSGDQRPGRSCTMPVIFPKRKPETLCFTVPQKVLGTRDWRAVVVFGDKNAADAAVYPRGLVSSYEFPERKQVEKPQWAERKAAMDPVVEHVVKTGNKKQPQLTLFLRPPIGMTDASEAQGVLAMCLLANDVGEIRRRMQRMEPDQELDGLCKFAQKHKLVILCWGSSSLWDPRKSWDEQSKAVAEEMDESFDDVANAWAKGVEQLSRKYGIHSKGFLLWGISGSAQYACRLALRKPEYFLAVHVHVPSSFDKPTPEANRVLWCLTTGEIEMGHERSLRFLSACRELGYPIIYKAIIGLGHAGHPLAERLGLDFFEYALSVREERAELETEMAKTSSDIKREWAKYPNRPWPKSFRNPPFVGDVVNQQVSLFEKANMVPAGFRTMLPSPELAETWVREQ